MPWKWFGVRIASIVSLTNGANAEPCLCWLTISVLTEKGKTMFRVVHKETGEVRTVYGMAGIRFLFWNHEEKCWEYGDMEKYIPATAIQ